MTIPAGNEAIEALIERIAPLRGQDADPDAAAALDTLIEFHLPKLLSTRVAATNADDVSSRILAAATLAEQHAASMKPGDRRYITLRLSGQELDFERMITAAGPSHWGAVATGLRAIDEAFDRTVGVTEYGLNEYGRGRQETLLEIRRALLPLVDQIIRDLGHPNAG